jgi:uncharacterized protein (UPF0261 family)
LESTVRQTTQRRIERVPANINAEAFITATVAPFQTVAPRRERSA